MSIFLLSFRFWYPGIASIMATYCTFVSLESILFSVGLLCIGLMSAWLSLARSRHNCTVLMYHAIIHFGHPKWCQHLFL